MKQEAIELLRRRRSTPSYLPPGIPEGAYHRFMDRILHSSESISASEWQALAQAGLVLGRCACIPMLLQARDPEPSGETLYCYELVSDLAAEHLLAGEWGYQAELDGSLIVLLCYQYSLDPEQEAAVRSRIGQQCRAMITVCRERYGLQLSVYPGKFIPSIGQVAEEYEHLRKYLLFNRFFECHEGLFTSDNLNEPAQHVFSILRFAEVAAADTAEQIKKRDYTLRELGMQHLEVLRTMRPMDADVLRDNYKYLVEHIFDTLLERRMILPRQITLDRVAWSYMVGCKSWSDMVARYLDFLEAMFKLSQENAAVQSHSSTTEVMAYICANYQNPSLSMKEIAQRFHSNPSTICSAFKRYYGITVFDQIRALRMEAACDLLKNTAQTLGEVAERSGFGSKETMNRIFKRRFGVTPGQYRGQPDGVNRS